MAVDAWLIPVVGMLNPIVGIIFVTICVSLAIHFIFMQALNTSVNGMLSMNLQTISTIVQMISIVILVIITGYYAKKTSELARKEARPRLKLFYHVLSPGTFILAVGNFGTGASLQNDISISYVLKGAQKEKRIFYPCLGVNESLKILDVSDEDKIEGIKTVENISATFEYKDIDNKEYKEKDVVYPKKFWESDDTRNIMYERPPIERVAKTLEKIEKKLKE